MATTSGLLALRSVQAVLAAGVEASVLHREADLARAVASSDVDVVVDRPLVDVVDTARAHWHDVGLRPVVVWPYDVGGTGTVFLATDDATDGVQLDMLHDPSGRGQYGARSPVLLRHSGPGEALPCVEDGVAAAYLLSKRLAKGEVDRAGAIIESIDGRVLLRTVDEVLAPRSARAVRRYLLDGTYRRPRRAVGLGRLIHRVRHPIGAWVATMDTAGADVVEAVAGRFDRFLPHVAFIPPYGSPGRWRVVPQIRWRAGVVFSVGAGPIRKVLGPDLILGAALGEDQAARAVVDYLEGSSGG